MSESAKESSLVKESKPAAKPNPVKEPKTHQEPSKKPATSKKKFCCCCGGLLAAFIVFIIVLNSPVLKSIFVSGETNPIPSFPPTSTSKFSAPPTSSTTATPRPSETYTTSENYPAPAACEPIYPPDVTPISLSINDPGYHQDVNNYYYSIYGSTIYDLRMQKAECGPKWEGQSYAAITKWNVNWMFGYQYVGGGCSLENVTAGVRVDIYYPKWEQPESFASGLDTEWQRYIDALTVHENGHRDYALSDAQEIVNVLTGLPFQATCDEAGMVANETANSIHDSYSAQSAAYDDETNHGETQGANL